MSGHDPFLILPKDDHLAVGHELSRQQVKDGTEPAIVTLGDAHRLGTFFLTQLVPRAEEHVKPCAMLAYFIDDKAWLGGDCCVKLRETVVK